MGVDYDQLCIIGVKLRLEDLKVIETPAQYEDQNRYDTKTGKVIGTERVLVKREKYYYKFFNKKYEDIYDIDADYPTTYVCNEENVIYIGEGIHRHKWRDYGSVTLMHGKASFDDIEEDFQRAEGMFPGYEIGMYFIGRVG